MPIADIIHEIDAYLVCLRHARNLLATPVTGGPRKRAPRGQKKVKAAKTETVVSSKPRIQKKKSGRPSLQGKRPAPPRTVVKKRPDPVSPIRGTVAPQAADRKQPPIAPTKPTPHVVQRVILSPERQKSSVRSARRSAAKAVSRAKPDDSKPAIALAGAMHSRIVVVPAEQAKRERNRAALPAVRRPRVPAAGLSGKQAFEALFKDAPESPGTSEQKPDAGEPNSREAGPRPTE